MEALHRSESGGAAALCSMVELLAAETLLAAERSLLWLLLAVGSLSSQTGPLGEGSEGIYGMLRRNKHEAVLENKDDGESDDNEDEDDNDEDGDDQEDGGEDDLSGEENDNEGEEDANDPDANGGGGSEEEDDEDDDEDDEEEEEDEEDDEDEEDEEDEELPQPPTKKRK